MKLSHSLVLTLPVLSGWATAADLTVKFEIPQLNVAEYHKPYIAMWVENADQAVAANLAVLYDVKKKDNAGTKWLKDIRTWWRKAGREMTSYDGISGATRAAGEQTISFGPAKTGFDKLPAGDYKLVVEASRESGGRELVKVPFTWPTKGGKQSASAAGKEELGKVALTITP